MEDKSMSLLAIIGWILIGTVAATCLITFWDDIKVWLNNTAANAVEKVLGYGARERMHKATAKIDKIVNKIRNNTVVFTKKSNLETYYDKTTIVAESPIYEIPDDVISEINKNGSIVQVFEYRN